MVHIARARAQGRPIMKRSRCETCERDVRAVGAPAMQQPVRNEVCGCNVAGFEFVHGMENGACVRRRGWYSPLGFCAVQHALSCEKWYGEWCARIGIDCPCLARYLHA